MGVEVVSPSIGCLVGVCFLPDGEGVVPDHNTALVEGFGEGVVHLTAWEGVGR